MLGNVIMGDVIYAFIILLYNLSIDNSFKELTAQIIVGFNRVDLLNKKKRLIMKFIQYSVFSLKKLKNYKSALIQMNKI